MDKSLKSQEVYLISQEFDYFIVKVRRTYQDDSFIEHFGSSSNSPIQAEELALRAFREKGK